MKSAGKNNKIISYTLMMILSSVVLMFGNPILNFILSVILLGLIIIKARYSFFSVFSFIMVFSYLQAVVQKITGLASGTLRWAGHTMPLYFTEMSIATITLLLTILFVVFSTGIVMREKELYKNGPGISFFAGALFLIIAVVLVLLLFPSFPTFHMDSALRRTQGLTKYYGLLLIALNISALTFNLSFKHKWFLGVYAFILFWVLGHGERVEILGFLVLFVLTYLNHLEFSELKKRIIANRKRIIYILSFLMLIAMMYVGMTRMGDGTNVSVSSILYNLVVQPTCGDVVYVFNCAIDMWKHGNGLWGYSYLDYPLQLIPGATGEFQIAVIMLKNYTVMGGGLFFTEPMANFGLVGTILSNIEFCVVYYLILKKTTRFRLFFWTPIVVEIFRTAWYGRSGWILSSFIIMPIIYLMCKYIFNRIQIKTRK